MNVIAYDIRPRPERAQELVFRCVSLDGLLTGSDIISLDANLNPSSYHILNGEAFAKRGRELILGDPQKFLESIWQCCDRSAQGRLAQPVSGGYDSRK